MGITEMDETTNISLERGRKPPLSLPPVDFPTHGLAEFVYLKSIFFFWQNVSLGNLSTPPPCTLTRRQAAIASVLEPMLKRANLGPGHILPPLRDGVYGERWGWAAADVTAGPT